MPSLAGPSPHEIVEAADARVPGGREIQSQLHLKGLCGRPARRRATVGPQCGVALTARDDRATPPLDSKGARACGGGPRTLAGSRSSSIRSRSAHLVVSMLPDIAARVVGDDDPRSRPCPGRAASRGAWPRCSWACGAPPRSVLPGPRCTKVRCGGRFPARLTRGGGGIS